MPSLSIMTVWPGTHLPPELLAVLGAGCLLLAAMSLGLIVRRTMTVQRSGMAEAASLFAVREIASCLHAEGPVDVDLLRKAIAAAPVAAVMQLLRLQRGADQALLIAEAELAGTFDPALQTLESGVVSREIEALKQLQFARAPRFRAAVRKKVMRSPSVLVRCEALYTFIAMGSNPSPLALADWIDRTGPDLTPRHRALFHLIAERLPGTLEPLAAHTDNADFQEALQVLLAERRQHEARERAYGDDDTAGDGPLFAQQAA